MSVLRKNAKSTGIISETMAIAAFTKLGYQVSLPYGDNASYDLVIEKQGVLERVQVKTALYNDRSPGCFVVRTCSTQKPTKYKDSEGAATITYDKTKVDYIACYCVKQKKLYLIPVEDISRKTCMTLRYKKNLIIKRMRKDIAKASQYEIFSF